MKTKKIVAAALAATMLTGSALAEEWWHIEIDACRNQDFDPSKRLGPPTPANAYESVKSMIGHAPTITDDGVQVSVCIVSQFGVTYQSTRITTEERSDVNIIHQCLIYFRTRKDCEELVRADAQEREARRAKAEAEQQAEKQKLDPYR